MLYICCLLDAYVVYYKRFEDEIEVVRTNVNCVNVMIYKNED